MGFADAIKSQFVDVIEYTDQSNKIIIKKYERPGDEIKQGAQLIVRESQAGLFLKQGQLADVFNPGRYTLNTDNLPVLSSLGAFKFGFNSPIKADLYFVSMRQFTDNRWGTKNPIPIRDAEFNMARVRAFGKYAFRITDPIVFMREVFGTIALTTTYDIIEYLDGLIVEAAAVTFSSGEISILDFATLYRSFGEKIATQANAISSRLGIEITMVVIESVSLPDEVEKMIDEQSGIGMASKNMGGFMQYQTARAMRDAAKQEGGLAGLGAGMALGNNMASQIAASQVQDDKADTIQQLRDLKALLDEGIIEQTEFDAKKKQLLGL